MSLLVDIQIQPLKEAANQLNNAEKLIRMKIIAPLKLIQSFAKFWRGSTKYWQELDEKLSQLIRICWPIILNRLRILIQQNFESIQKIAKLTVSSYFNGPTP